MVIFYSYVAVYQRVSVHKAAPGDLGDLHNLGDPYHDRPASEPLAESPRVLGPPVVQAVWDQRAGNSPGCYEKKHHVSDIHRQIIEVNEQIIHNYIMLYTPTKALIIMG